MIGIIIQARTGSSRLPKKIYKDLNGKYTLQRVLGECKKSKLVNRIILAMPEYDSAEIKKRMYQGELKDCIDGRFRLFFGSSEDLVDRYFKAATKFDIHLIVRITADCPTTQAKLIDSMLIEYMKNGYNGFMGNNECVSSIPYPDGTDIEIFPLWMLAETHRDATLQQDREHVTPYMYKNRSKYNVYEFHNKEPNPVIDMKFTGFSLDTQQDYELLTEMIKHYDQYNDLNKAIELTEFRDNKGK